MPFDFDHKDGGGGGGGGGPSHNRKHLQEMADVTLAGIIINAMANGMCPSCSMLFSSARICAHVMVNDYADSSPTEFHKTKLELVKAFTETLDEELITLLRDSKDKKS